MKSTATALLLLLSCCLTCAFYIPTAPLIKQQSLALFQTTIRSPTCIAMSNLSTNETTAVSSRSKRKIEWTVRPARLDDKEMVDRLLWKSYSHLLKRDYDEDFLKIALPKITVARDELLTCGTWYVVEAPPSTNSDSSSSTPDQLVGCGGFTLQSPTKKKKDDDDDDNKNAMDVPHLRHFATDPDFARQGIASAIWNRTWKDLCHHYITHYNLPFPPAMEVFSTLTAESFYASLGFRTVEKVSIPLGEDCPFPALLMKRETSNKMDGDV
jgi:Acetyltransferase (GNAT) domain